MIKKMITDETFRSLYDYGSSEFPFAFYSDDLEQYQDNMIDLHWHRSLECSYIIKGTVCFTAGHDTYTLNVGDALYIGSGVFHSFSSDGAAELLHILFEPELLADPGSRLYTDVLTPILTKMLHQPAHVSK